MTNETKAQNALTEPSDLIEFDVIEYDCYDDVPFELHSHGCADATRKTRNAFHNTIKAASIDAALDMVIDEELRNMGYDHAHVHVFPCCDNHS